MFIKTPGGAARQAEESLRRSEEKFKKAFASSPDGIVMSRIRDGQIVEVNESFVRASGYSREEVIGRTTVDLHLWADPGDQDRYREALAGGGSVRDQAAQFRHKTGELLDGLVFGEMIHLGEEPVALTTIRDVTEKKRGERELRETGHALRESETRFREIAENIKEVFWVTDPAQTRTLYVSPAYEEICGRTCESLYEDPRSFAEAIHPDDRERALARMYSRTGADSGGVYRIQRPDGSLRWIRARAFPVHGPGGEVIRLVGSAQDITELKETEEALRGSEARYRSLFEGSPDGILVADASGRYVDVNPSGLAMLGYSREELVGLTSLDIVAPREHPRVEVALMEINGGHEHRHEWEFRRKDGSRFHADVLATSMSDGRILALVRDASDRKRMEEQLRQSQKMEAVGRLAGGIAHDFNNILGVIMGYGEMLRGHTPEDHPDRRRVDQIVRAAERGADLTRQLLAFSRKQVLEPKVLEPSVVVTHLRKLLEPLIGEHIELVLKAEARGRVKVDPGQLEQVVVNLVVNARDAMPGGGGGHGSGDGRSHPVAGLRAVLHHEDRREGDGPGARDGLRNREAKRRLHLDLQ